MPPTPPAADGFHEPRRTDCPWCGSRRLRTRLHAPRRTRRTPGTFVVDECLDCRHAFQNPRLTAEGLATHHRDFYEQHLAPFAARVRATRRHRARARALLRFPGFPEPESWLDVGTGHARFPQTARELFAYTSFDGLDTTPRVAAARAAGRIEEAHLGRLTDQHIRNRLRARYDVVSMFHHLEHTPDPRAELRAALHVLRPGGHLLLEVPDPRSAFAALLGKWWLPYGTPRHLHLLPLDNLRAELQDQGYVVVAADRRAAHTPYDLSAALTLAFAHLLPRPLLRVAAPLVALATALDHACAPLLRRTRFSNAYRIIARRGDGPPPPCDTPPGQPRSTSA
ncbi:class I SAM-dependent methyltransferase [Streptomyces mangrovisoli]|uniref:Methyltransferase type 12 n=1 Tax=Streptomyces mangrovisoli TaxID=1428628 RepID=A0A1J4NKS5_9ACTN|nr:class I SAM-dependent methyltransferase [Streptomyces mangrovisoli]OIJ62899.1 methyltransferase type 12 [Streptomyces mangrovisoli]